MKRTLLAALLLPLISQAQTTEFGNLNVVQNDSGNLTTSVTVTKGAGSSPNFAIRTGSNKADYNVTFGNTNDYDTGVLVATISENGRNNNAVGETIGTFYTTVGVDLDSATTPNRYYLALFRAPNAEEQNENVACAFFPCSQWLGGAARNAANTNGGATDTLKASAGINLGAQFTTAGAGVFGLNLTTINAAYTSQNGILLVNHLKNEDNYAASFVNGSGFTMHVRDNGSTGTAAAPATEQDPIAFVYLHTADVGTKQLKAMGRVNSDASTDVSGGSFTVTKGGTGQWYLSIPGMSPTTGTLIVSPEGGATNNVDNIISYQWDAANTRYVIESRDIVSTTAAPVLEDGATTGEDMFSFAFFEAPVAPTVAITSPSNGSNVITGTAFDVEATAADANGTVTQVEFFRNGVSVGTDASAPFSFNQTGLTVGAYSFTARATDNDGFTTTSAAVVVNVTLDPNNLPANTALWFDGVNDYVTMGTALDLGAGGPPTNGLTLECWFRRDGTGVTSSSGSGGVTAVPLFGKGRGEGDGSNVDCNYFFGITTAGILVADFEAYPATGITSGQNYPITATNTPITNGTWNHAAVTYDGATFTWKMYLNGVEVGSTTAIAGALPRYDSIQHFGIGTAMTSAGTREGAFHGIIDEVRVWNYARSAAEIAATKDVAVAAGTGLVGRYGLNEGTGTTTASSTGTTAGTLTNGPLWIEGATLVSNDPPTVSITAPANNATFNAPAAFTISATASDPDGSISKVEFFSGATKLGEDTTSPYSLDVSGLAQGSYSYTARATDNFGAFANSSVINVTVEAPLTTPPTVSITSPAYGAIFLAPAAITINANAADSDGTVAKVEFFNGATKLGEDTTAPYSFVWSNVAIGSYTLTAKATDDMTANTTSSAVAVSVIANQVPTISLTTPADLATNAGTGGTVTLSASVADPESQPMTVTFYGRLKSPPVGPDFTLVTLPDTQFYSENTGGTRLQHFLSQTNWIVANRNTLNIPFVAHMGDMVQNGDAVQQEWINADSAMDIIEDPATTLLTHGIPWGGAPGNHDQQPIGSPDGASLYWNTYFGTARWAGRPYWGGNYSTNNDNNYQFFSASGLDFIVINLEYRSSASQAVLDWADALLKAHPNRRAIITSHWFIGTGNPAAWGGHGQAVYDNLKDNPNLFLMLCGHIHGEGQRADVFEGRTVHTVLQDYQSRTNGGDSWLRYFVFSPANNTITAKTLQTRTLTFETDADSEFTLPYTMGAGTAAWTALGTVNAAGGVASLDWTGVAGNTEYEWYAAVSDGTNNVGSTARTFTTAANAAPTVSLTSPAEGASVVLPAQVAFAASAADSDGSVSKVEFFAGSTQVGEDTTAPFSFDWTAISGSYALTAVATDNQGATTTSAVVNIIVTNPANMPPTVSITSPASGFSTENSTLTINATAADTDGSITKVEFFEGSNKLGEDTTAPFAYNWTGVSVGTYSLTAKATDNDGGITTSTAVSVTFTPPGNFLGSMTQNFDSMGTAGTTPPGTWTVWNAASGTTNSTWTSSVLASSLPAMTAVSALSATTTPTGNDLNGFNAAASAGDTANRVLASAPTTVAGMAFQVLLTNGTAAPINALKIGFDTIRYTSVATANELPGYWLFFSLDGGTTWTNASDINPTITTVPNTTGTSVTAPTTISLGANWNVGSPLLLRWVDDNATQTSPDQIIGLDNVSIVNDTPVTSVDLSTYVRIARINLPEYRRTALPVGTPAHNLLCDEASAVTYNWDTDTLFITGDGGRAVTQVSKTGQLIDTMSLELNAGNPQGTEFYDPEGLTYIGGGQFVLSEERERRLVKFTYAAGTTLTRAAAQTVDIGTFDDNTGTEGLSYDPQTSGFIVLKEKTPIGVFQTGVDFAAGTATNGSPTTVNSTNLFDTTLLGMTDVADVFAFSNIPSMTGQPQAGNLLILSQENARVVNIDRSGNILSTLNITSDPGNPLSAADQQHEGITMDRAGIIYVVNENGGGSIEYPQLWVYAPSNLPNQAPTAITLNNAVNSLEENTSTASPIKLADIVVTDDGLGTNTLSLTGADAASFQLTGSALYLKSGVVLDFETKTSYTVTINADDTTVGTTPDVTQNFTLNVTDQLVEAVAPPALIVTEVAPWASGNGAVGGDWFEVTNVSANAVDITGWKVDDSSNAFATAIALNGITSISPGESVIFIESSAANQATIVNTFKTVWFGSNVPAGLQVGTYQGSGIGLSTGGDAVNLFIAGGTRHSGVTFGAADASSPYQTFDNTAAANDTAISLLSTVGVNGAFIAATSSVEIGSPGYSSPGMLRVTEVAPWSSGNSPVAADWFEVTNIGARAVDITGWKVDDNSESPAAALPLTGITMIAPGESVIFIETATLSTTKANFLSNWFGTNPPATLQIGSYTGGGIGLSTGGDAVNLYDTNNVRVTNVAFGIAPSSAPFRTFDNAAAANVASVSTLSQTGVNGAFAASSNPAEIGSPGVIAGGAVGFAVWLAQNGFTGTPGADSDNDGVSDTLEYFFNTSPNNPADRAHLPNVVREGVDLEFRFTRLQNSTLNGTLRYSTDLLTWQNAVQGVDYEIVSQTVSSGEVEVRYRLLNPINAKFFQLRVE